MGNAISEAVMEGDLFTLNTALDEDPERLKENVQEAFLTAAEYGEAAIVEAMLRRGAQVDVANQEGQTAIWLCSKVSDNRECRILSI